MTIVAFVGFAEIALMWVCWTDDTLAVCYGRIFWLFGSVGTGSKYLIDDFWCLREVGEVGEGVCSRDFPSLNLLDRISPNRFSGIRRSFTRPLPTRPQSWSCCARSTGSRSAMRGNRCGDLTEISINNWILKLVLSPGFHFGIQLNVAVLQRSDIKRCGVLHFFLVF